MYTYVYIGKHAYMYTEILTLVHIYIYIYIYMIHEEISTGTREYFYNRIYNLGEQSSSAAFRQPYPKTKKSYLRLLSGLNTEDKTSQPRTQPGKPETAASKNRTLRDAPTDNQRTRDVSVNCLSNDEI